MENTMNTTTQSKCYTVEDIMRILGVGRKAVYALIHTKAIHAIQIKGIGYRIPRELFDNWLMNRV